MQVVALLLAAGGMIFMVSSLQILPWISLYLAITFACYGFVRKVTPVDGIMGLTIETFLLSPIALCLLLIWNTQSPLVFGSADRALDVRIALSGLVTIIPLICFAQGIRRISLLTMGFLQYLSPTLQLICAVALLNETFTTAHWITFSFIWVGLLLFIIDSTVQWQKKKGAIRQQKLANELPPEPAKPAPESHSARTKECLAGENCSL
ncbi:MAG: EamA family transporter [Zavarzinella sp.]